MFRLLLLTAVTSAIRVDCSTVASATVKATMKATDFEVYGRVQGVFFRKYTKLEADKLELRGWCKNTYQGTVLGHIQGPSDKVESMATLRDFYANNLSYLQHLKQLTLSLQSVG